MAPNLWVNAWSCSLLEEVTARVKGMRMLHGKHLVLAALCTA